MSVEFVSHIARTFRMSTLMTRVQRAEYTLAYMGPSVSNHDNDKNTFRVGVGNTIAL